MYDGDGKRLQKTENSTTTFYIYSGINTVYEVNSTGSASYVYGPTGLIAKRTTIDQESNTYFYHKDHLGSIRSVTDSSKNIIVASTYHPFGETEVEEGSEHFLYNGKEKDTTNLYYYGARYYDPQIGRFITRDSLKGRINNSQTLNRFSYCLNNSIKHIDIWGKEYSPADQEVENHLSGKDDQTDDSDDDPSEPPEIIGDPYYENGKITLPTTEGDVEILNAHKTGPDGTPKSYWSQWKEKAKAKRLENKAEKLREIANKLLDKSSSAAKAAISVAVLGLVLCCVFPPAGLLIGLSFTVYGIVLGGSAWAYSDTAQDFMNEAGTLYKASNDIYASLP